MRERFLIPGIVLRNVLGIVPRIVLGNVLGNVLRIVPGIVLGIVFPGSFSGSFSGSFPGSFSGIVPRIVLRIVVPRIVLRIVVPRIVRVEPDRSHTAAPLAWERGTAVMAGDNDGDIHLLTQSVLDFAERALETVVTEIGQPVSSERHSELFDLCSQVLQYAVLLETVTPFAVPLIECLRALLRLMAVDLSIPAVHHGRPRIEIMQEQLIFLVESRFRISDIASMLCCSRRTIERRLQEFGITSHHYSTMSECNLDQVVGGINLLHPHIGVRVIRGQLESQGIHVQRVRVRESLRRVDPMGVELRVRRVLHRRVYSVESPNALWHLDGYHKLIRWRFVIHGAIDGYSRLIMFLRGSTNNRASTVLSAFTSAIDQYGLPSRIRMDRGGENILVSEYMLAHPERGPGRGSAIVGRSVHNQRIERLWRDLYAGCVCFFYNLFYSLEDSGLLDINDPRDVYALHFIFLPILRKQLDIFREGWAHHSLRTERYRTPQQLWVSGLCLMQCLDPTHAAVSGMSEVCIL